MSELQRLIKRLSPDAPAIHRQDAELAGATLATLYSHVVVLRSALEVLMNEQNGAPLLVRERQWTAAMRGCRAALDTSDPDKDDHQRNASLCTDGCA